MSVLIEHHLVNGLSLQQLSISMAADSRECLTLKVMRLSNPPLEAEPWSLLRPEEALLHDSASLSDKLKQEKLFLSQALQSSHILLLPEVQGRLFTGECFNGYVNLLNASNTQAANITVQVELLVGQRRSVLFDNAMEPVWCLNPGESFDCRISHQLTEIGIHSLVCSVSHHLPALGEQKTFRKSFKFSAEPPLKVSHDVDHLQGRAFVECALENVSAQPLLLSGATVICQEGVEGLRLDTPDQLNRASAEGIHYFKPGDRFNLLFCLTPTATKLALEDAYLSRLPLLGQLSLEWRAPGGPGSTFDYKIENRVEISKPLKLRVISCPASVEVETQFQVEIEASAPATQRRTKLLLHLLPEELDPFIIQGALTRHLEPSEPLRPARYTLEVMCLSPGLQSLKGLVLQDAENQQSTNPTDVLCQVLVF